MCSRINSTTPAIESASSPTNRMSDNDPTTPSNQELPTEPTAGQSTTPLSPPGNTEFDWEDDAVYRLGLLPDDTFGELTPEQQAKIRPVVEAANARQAKELAALDALRKQQCSALSPEASPTPPVDSTDAK